MATLDFARLFRSSIGFDQLPSLFAHALEGAGRRHIAPHSSFGSRTKKSKRT